MRLLVALALALCAGLALASAPLHHHQRSREVLLRGHTLDTRDVAAIHADASYLRRARSPDALEQYLIHVRGPVTADLRRSIEAHLDRELGTYLPHNTFLLVAPHHVAVAARSAPGVLWVGAFHPEFKLPRSGIDRDTRALAVSLHSEFFPTQLDQLAAAWSERLQARVETSHRSLMRVHLTAKGADARAAAEFLAEQAEVHWVEAVYPMFEHASNYSATGLVESGSPLPASVLAAAGLNGGGAFQEVLGIADSGLDWSNCYFGDPDGAPPAEGDPDFNRKVVKYITKYADNLDATGHGTGVASLAAANATAQGDARQNGLAAGAKLYVTDLGLGANPLRVPPDVAAFLLEPWTDGVRVHVNAFGTNAATYDAATQAVDNFVVAHPDALLVWSAGNSGYTGPGSVGAPALAKNVLTVGASLNSYEAILADASPELADRIAENPTLWRDSVVAGFGSRGPTYDGRIKPDLVAPGAYVGVAAPGACAFNASAAGTSYAAGLVGAAAALVRQYLRAGYLDGHPDPNVALADPSAALLKAALVTATEPCTGRQGAGGRYFDLPGDFTAPEYGFGHVNLARVLYLDTEAQPWGTRAVFVDRTEGLATGELHKYCFALAPGAPANPSIRATLVWTDAAGSPAAGIALVNNLDLLVVDSRGEQTRANGLAEFDALNNVESVVATTTAGAGANASFAVFVYGTNVPVGVLPGALTQPYALVVAGPVVRGGQCPDLCPSACSGHGTCNDGVCECASGWSGIDCSITPCPSGCLAVDGKPNGRCDYETGTCVCGPAFSGPDCRAPFNPPPAPVNRVRNGIPVGTVVAIVIIIFVVGGLFCAVVGWFIAVKWLEKKRSEHRDGLLGN